MAKAATATATVKATGKDVKLYASKVRHGKWIDETDCETEYAEDELINLKRTNE